MTLITNFTRAQTGQNRLFGAGLNPVMWQKPAILHQTVIVDDVANYAPHSSIPTGTEPPYSLHLASEGGELSSSIYVSGSGAVSGAMILTRDLAADLSGAGELEGGLSLLTSLAATLDGSGDVSGDLALLIALSASLSGTGTLDASSDLKLRVNFDTNLAGSSGVTGDLVGDASLEANIFVNSGSATTQEIVEAVWNALASSYNTTGSMGEKLNGAGSAGNPWTETIETGMNAAQAMRLITAALAGELSGAGSSTITIRSAVADDANRITATVDGDGNRTAITYDLD